MTMKRNLIVASVVGGMMASGASFATNGYFSHGFGIKSKGMGGGGAAFANDSAMAIANNPATLSQVSDQFTMDVSFFRPVRGYEYESTVFDGDTIRNRINQIIEDLEAESGLEDLFKPFVGPIARLVGIITDTTLSGFGASEGVGESDRELFIIPSMAASYSLSENDTIGIAMYGNGGLNTTYEREAGNLLGFGSDEPMGTFGQGRVGVNLEQLFITPTYSREFFDDQLSVGIAPVIARQKFRAYGLENFNGDGQAFAGLLSTVYPELAGDRSGSFSVDSANMTSNGSDIVWGYGGKLGLTYQPNDRVTIGASYQSKIHMDEFDKYSGLFAQGGSFDVPPTWSVGIATQVVDDVMVTFDYQRIEYEEVKSISNPSTDYLKQCARGDDSKCLGGEDGAGFGWNDINVYKLGVQWQATPKLQLRAGYNHGDNPIEGSDALFNVLAPGVVTDHYTAGFTYSVNERHQVHGSFMYVPENTVSGKNELLSDILPSADQDVKIGMEQYEAAIGYTYKF